MHDLILALSKKSYWISLGSNIIIDVKETKDESTESIDNYDSIREVNEEGNI